MKNFFIYMIFVIIIQQSLSYFNYDKYLNRDYIILRSTNQENAFYSSKFLYSNDYCKYIYNLTNETKK